MQVLDAIAARHPDAGHDHACIDATAPTLVKNPRSLDVMFTENMFGDMLWDLGTGQMSGMGMVPSGAISDHHAVFQPALHCASKRRCPLLCAR